MSFDNLPFVYSAEVFGTNHAKMDEEHAGLFSAIDRLASVRSTQSFEDLAGLVIAHFNDEEQVSALSEGHLAAHRALLATATAKLDDLKSGAATVDDGLVDYLRKWLINHIKGTDIPSYGH